MRDEPAALPAKKLQTEVKHLIVGTYVGAWGGIIVGATRGPVRLALVDAFAGPGAYQADQGGEASEPGSPLLALDALDGLAAAHPRRRIQADALFIDADCHYCRSLEQRLRARSQGKTTWRVECGEFADLTDAILRFTQDRFGLVLIDPFGPKGAPLGAVRAVIDQPLNDVVINLPYYSLHKWGRASEEGVEAAQLFGHIQAASDFFGTPQWREIAHDSKTPDECERRLVQLYKSQIHREGVDVISVPLLMPQASQTIYHLVFASANVAGLLRMKEIMQKAREHEDARRYEARERRELERTGMPRLFDVPPVTDVVPDVDIEDLAEAIYQRFRGTSGVEFEDVYQFGVYIEGVLKSHLDKALTRLKRLRRASFARRRSHDRIDFSD